MAPKRKGSFLTRGRQRVQQTQQMKQSAARQLPPKGGTGANKPKATAQRTATAVTQRVRQDVATLRALGENMKRNQARAERQIPADKSPSVRRVGPGGANPKPQGQLPPGRSRPQLPAGKPGGSLATTAKPASPRRQLPADSRGGNRIGNSSQPWGNRPNSSNSPRVSSSRALPPGKPGGPLVSGGARPKPAATSAKPSVKPSTGGRMQQLKDWVAGNTPKQQANPGSKAVQWLGGDLPKGTARAASKTALSGAGRALVLPALVSQIADVGKGFQDLANSPFLNKGGTGTTGTRTGRTGRGGTTNDVGGNPARDGRYIPGSQQVEIKDRSGRPKPPSAPTLPASVRSSTSGGSSGSSTRASSPTGRSSSAPKPPSTTGSSKPQDNSAPKPPNLPKVETETSDAPKPPAIESSASKKSYKRVLGASRQDMIEDNIRRARKKSS